MSTQFADIQNWKEFKEQIGLELAKEVNKKLRIDVQNNGAEPLKVIYYSLEGMCFFELVEVLQNTAIYKFTSTGA